ncbi:MAG: putative ABC transporter permease [Spirochaetales bacterium]|nr:putative ABC transporter permease [Spirochaetales bacterium]
MPKKKSETEPYIKTVLEQCTEEVLSAAETQNTQNNEMYIRLAKAAESDGSMSDIEYQIKAQSASLSRSVINLQTAAAKVSVMTDEMRARLHDVNARQKRRFLKNTVISNTQIDYEEERQDYFAKGNNIYKLILVLIISSFVGVIVETGWCFLKHGYIESRVGLVYGPFNLVYGLGGLVLTAMLYRFRNHGSWLSFLGGLVVGSGIEYLCSFVQEKVFGSTSWDYSSMPLNINGRICLLYSVFWGLLGAWWIKRIYPFIAKQLLKIPNNIGRIVTIALAVFLILDAGISGAAVYRWSERTKGIAAHNSIERVLDARFTDRRMKWIFPNLVFSENEHAE